MTRGSFHPTNVYKVLFTRYGCFSGKEKFSEAWEFQWAPRTPGNELLPEKGDTQASRCSPVWEPQVTLGQTTDFFQDQREPTFSPEKRLRSPGQGQDLPRHSECVPAGDANAGGTEQ